MCIDAFKTAKALGLTVPLAPPTGADVTRPRMRNVAPFIDWAPRVDD